MFTALTLIVGLLFAELVSVGRNATPTTNGESVSIPPS